MRTGCSNAGSQGFQVAEVVASGNLGSFPPSNFHHIMEREPISNQVGCGGVPGVMPHEVPGLPPGDDASRLARVAERIA